MKQNKFTTKIYDIMADKEMNIVFIVLDNQVCRFRPQKEVLNSVEEMQLN